MQGLSNTSKVASLRTLDMASFSHENIIHKPFNPKCQHSLGFTYIQYLTEHKINKTSIQKVNHTSPVTGFFPYFFKYGTIFLATEEDLCTVHVHLVAYLKHFLSLLNQVYLQLYCTAVLLNL